MVTSALLGFILGFMGYLPPGNINLSVVQMALGHSVKKMWFYIAFAALMEFIYCFGCLMGLNVLLHQPQLVVVLKWCSVCIFFLLGLLSFFHNEQNSKVRAFSGQNRAIFAAIVNPFQIPFWLLWGVYLTDNKWLAGNTPSLAVFAFITALGTVAILWVYALGGKKLVEEMKLERRFIDRFVGLLLIALGCWQLFKNLHQF